MGETTGISWTGATWNPWIGCTKKSPGCRSCYMYREMERYGKNPRECVRTKPATFRAPLKWAREVREGKRRGIDRVVFTCSWSDWNNVEADDWRADAWEIIRRTPELSYLILTKLPERFTKTLPPDWGTGWPHVGLGTSIESEEYAGRVHDLRQTPAAMRFLSIEPCLGGLYWFRAMTADIYNLPDWAILGGESDHQRARPFNVRWVDEFLDICRTGEIAPFVKQIGSNPESVPRREIPMGNDWKGGDWSTWPERWRVREFPPNFPSDYTPPKQAGLF